MLPTDLAIFSAPIRTMPLCIQIRASGRPRAASVWAISFSWWGKTRSEPPPWISKSVPSSCSAIAEHSMCQPGPALSPRRGPGGVLALLARLPQGEVLRALLELRGVVALALAHVLARAGWTACRSRRSSRPGSRRRRRPRRRARSRSGRRSGRRSDRSSRPRAARGRAGRGRARRCRPRSARSSRPPAPRSARPPARAAS